MNYRMGLTAASRFLVLVGLAVWIGGLIFLGAVAAPLTFKVARANHSGILAPQIVGAMVTRFNLVTYVCGVLLLLGWLGESLSQGVTSGLSRKLWGLQGLCSGVMLLIALYAGLVMMPRLNGLQQRMLPQLARASTISATTTNPDLSPAEQALKAEFDTGHQRYQQVSMVAWWLGVITLLSVCVRTSLARAREGVIAEREVAAESFRRGSLVGEQ